MAPVRPAAKSICCRSAMARLKSSCRTNSAPTTRYNSSYVGCYSYAVTIALAKVATTINVYHPITGATPLNSYVKANSVTVTSCMDPLIIEVIP